MFARSVQPDVVSLFSSTGSEPLGLFAVHVDESLPADSFVHLLNDKSSLPAPPSPAVLIATPSVFRDSHAETSSGHELNQTVLHIQSPTLRRTFIQCPPSSSALPGASSGDSVLGLKHAWLHIQVRNLSREWSFQVGIVDKAGRQGVVRCSTFQKSPRLVRNPGASPLLHLPLAFPPPSSSPLTAWSTVTLNLAKFVPQFASLASIRTSTGSVDDEDEAVDEDVDDGRPPAEMGEPSNQVPLPSGTYSHLAFIKIHASCRLRRIWLSDSAPITRTPWEFELYGD